MLSVGIFSVVILSGLFGDQAPTANFAPTEVRVTAPEVCKHCGAPCRAEDGECVNCYECFARAAPEDRELDLRPPEVGLSRPETVTADRLVFVVFVLALVTYDGLMATPLWLGVRTFAAPVVGVLGISGLGSLYLIQTLGLISVPLLFLTAYLGFVKLAQFFSGVSTSTWRFASAYAYTLVPIALAYEAAHYYTLFIIQGQAIVALISDPFGRGWNLFGTAGYDVNVGIISADFVWYSQVADRDRARHSRVPGTRDRAPAAPVPEAGGTEPVPDGGLYGALYGPEPLDPQPADRRGDQDSLGGRQHHLSCR